MGAATVRALARGGADVVIHHLSQPEAATALAAKVRGTDPGRARPGDERDLSLKLHRVSLASDGDDQVPYLVSRRGARSTMGQPPRRCEAPWKVTRCPTVQSWRPTWPRASALYRCPL
ncbi:MAG: hypothetical protein AAFW98_11940 [Pseudomonadota bacterium]